MSEIRLQKFIADQGICSRRRAEKLILDGKVKVNGNIVNDMGLKINPDKDNVDVDGMKGINNNQQPKTYVYIALNKPVDYISSASSTQGRSVIDLLQTERTSGNATQDMSKRVYPVGRLDKDSEGLLLLTNDGELTNTLTHPSFAHEKEYEITIAGRLTKDTIAVLERGMSLGDERVQGITVKKTFNKGKRQIVTVILKEGKNRQIRKMFGRLGYDIITLKRTRIGKLKLGTLPIGKWKYIKKTDIV